MFTLKKKWRKKVIFTFTLLTRVVHGVYRNKILLQEQNNVLLYKQKAQLSATLHQKEVKTNKRFIIGIKNLWRGLWDNDDLIDSTYKIMVLLA